MTFCQRKKGSEIIITCRKVSLAFSFTIPSRRPLLVYTDLQSEPLKGAGKLAPCENSRKVSKITIFDVLGPAQNLSKFVFQKAADVWKKDVWEFQAFSQTFLGLRFFLGNEGKNGKNLNSQNWPGTPRRPSPRHPRPPES